MVAGYVLRAQTAAKQAVHAMRNDKGLLFLNLGTATGLLGFCMSDPIPLRSCSIISSAASVYFALTRNPILSYAPVVWSSMFIAVNSFKISAILFARLDTTLSPMEEEVYTKHFLPFGMRPREFKKLVQGATEKKYAANSLIESEVMFPSKLSVKLLTSGEAIVYKNNGRLFTVNANNPICFIGDISLLELEDSVIRVKPFISSAKAGSDEDVYTLEWEQEFLLKILREKSEMSTKLRSVLTNSVLRKLMDIDNSHSKSKYINLLRAFAVDGVIDDVEKTILKRYRENHNVDEVTHARGLAILGWTEEEFQVGRKQGSLSQSLQTLQKKLIGMLERQSQEEEEVNDIVLSIKKEDEGAEASAK